jgi:hypothetical protein
MLVTTRNHAKICRRTGYFRQTPSNKYFSGEEKSIFQEKKSHPSNTPKLCPLKKLHPRVYWAQWSMFGCVDSVEAPCGLLREKGCRASRFICDANRCPGHRFRDSKSSVQGQVNHCRQNQFASCLPLPGRTGAPDSVPMGCFF